jgi:hypothetical protein
MNKSKGRELIRQVEHRVRLETIVEVLGSKYQEERDTNARYSEALGRLMSTGRLLCDQIHEVYPDLDEAVEGGQLDAQLAAYMRGFRKVLYGLIPREKRTAEQEAMSRHTTGPPDEEAAGDAGDPGEASGVVEGAEGASEGEAEAPRDQGAE